MTTTDRMMYLLGLMADRQLPVLEAAELKRLLQEDLSKYKNDYGRLIRIDMIIWSLESYLLGRTNFMGGPRWVDGIT